MTEPSSCSSTIDWNTFNLLLKQLQVMMRSVEAVVSYN